MRIQSIAPLLFLVLVPAAEGQSQPSSDPTGEALAPARVSGLDPNPPPVLSMGQPTRTPIFWGLQAGYAFEKDVFTTRLFVDVVRKGPLAHLGWIDFTLEGAVGTSGSELDGAVGLYLGVPWLNAGFDYNFLDQKTLFGLSVQFALVRGGLFGKGDRIRLDYRPARKEVLLGFSLRPPFQQYRMTRPPKKTVRIPSGHTPSSGIPVEEELEEELQRIEHAVMWMDKLLTPRLKAGDNFTTSAEGYREHIRQNGHTFQDEESAYHRGLEMAFSLAVNHELAVSLAAEAEKTVLEEILVPFNSNFGQKTRPSHAGGYCELALERFSRYLDETLDQTTGLESAREAALEVFRRLLAAIEQVSGETRNRWTDRVLLWKNQTTLAWLPLNYGLRPEQYDTQEEWDDVLSALTGKEFAGANTIEYLMYERFHLELKKMIRETGSYQVTIVHDFRTYAHGKEPDIYSWDMVIDGYIAAFIQAIIDLDAGKRERLPQFFLFLDENYYQANKSRKIISYLENLYASGLDLKNDQIEEQIEAAHEKLLEVIRESPSLAKLNASQLASIFKVHINITNPYDPALTLDVTRRDHRKLAFRDVFEAFPDSGEAVFTGEGIGEHYNGSGWEDRSLLVRGSALVQLKSETRRLFLSQGYEPHEVPLFLKPMEYPEDYEERCEKLKADGWTVPVSIVMNQTGYGNKMATVMKAAIYNLAPPLSMILSYDSLWISEYWAAMFVGAALRGVRVFPLGPTDKNAPSDAAPTLYYLHRNLETLLRAQIYFGEDIKEAGGMMRVGLYAQDVPTDDLGERIAAFVSGRDAYPFMKELFPFHPSIAGFLSESLGEYEQVSITELQLRPRPLLHLKIQLFGTREAFEVVHLREWNEILTRHLSIRERQLQEKRTEGVTPKVLSSTAGANLDQALRSFLKEDSPGSEDRVILTFTIGSHNQNPRSMVLDGEVLVAVSGINSFISAIDFMFIMGVSDWPRSLEKYNDLFPPPNPSRLSKFFYPLIKYQL